MGYRSGIRIKLRVKDFETLKKKFNKTMLANNERLDKIYEQIKNCDNEQTKQELRKQLNTTYMSPLFSDDDLDMFKEMDEETWDEEDCGQNQIIEKIVYFGWDSLKWYDDYTDVRFVEDFVRDCDCYAYARIGEEYGDMDKEERGMYSIGTYTSFEDDE